MAANTEQSHPTVIIVGSGIAGLSLALLLNEIGIHSVLLSKARTDTSGSSWYAQGGLAVTMGSEESLNAHMDDTLKCACGLARPDVVELILKRSSAACHWLTRQGVEFDLDENGTPSLAMEGGHSQRRILHCKDATGRGIVNALINQVKQCGDSIRLLEHHIAVDLITDSKRVRGVYVLNQNSGQVECLLGHQTVLASGGISGIYEHCTNNGDAHGDGLAMAARAGCALTNMEFIQFHPTALYGSRGVLLSEALRGEGAKLCHADGETFMHKYHSNGDLAPRDVAARAIYSEMLERQQPCVYLDARSIESNYSQQRFPYIWEECRRYQLQPDRDLLPVMPSAHYSCGGVHVKGNGQTEVNGLYAIGETAWTGLHGANRLASNSLTECVVMAMLCRDDISGAPLTTLDEAAPYPLSGAENDPELDADIQARCDRISSRITRDLGIVRRADQLLVAARELTDERVALERALPQIGLNARNLKLRNILTCGELVAHSALQRHECRGLHYVEEYKDREVAPVGADTKVRLTPDSLYS